MGAWKSSKVDDETGNLKLETGNWERGKVLKF
jgi:hypothetical protein